MILSDGFKVPFARGSWREKREGGLLHFFAQSIAEPGELLGLAQLLCKVANGGRQPLPEPIPNLQGLRVFLPAASGMDLYNFLLNTPVWMLRRMKAECCRQRANHVSSHPPSQCTGCMARRTTACGGRLTPHNGPQGGPQVTKLLGALFQAPSRYGVAAMSVLLTTVVVPQRRLPRRRPLLLVLQPRIQPQAQQQQQQQRQRQRQQ